MVVALLICSVTHIPAIAGENADANGTRTDRYVMQYMDITVPDTYLQLTSSLKDSDPAWLTANVTDPSERRDDYKNRNIVAAYFDPETNCTVYFVAKQTSETLKAFDVTQYNDEEIVAYAKTLLPEDDTIKASVGSYQHPEMNMFRIKLSEIGENGDEELVFGTVVNGMLIQFSMDTQYIGSIKEDVLMKVVSGVHMTTVMTYEEYDARVKKTWIRIGCFFGAGILLMVIFYIISKVRKKKKKERVNLISERLYSFRKKKQAGEIDTSNVLFEVDTEYDKKLIATYCTYNTWFRNIVRDVIMAVIYVVIVGYAIYLGSKVVLILGVGAAFILIYYKYSHNEKYQDNLIKRYDLKKKKSVTAHFRFYEDFFTLSGIDSISEYIYKQVYKVANYQGYMLLYISEENALVIDVEKIPEGQREAFLKHVIEKSKLS